MSVTCQLAAKSWQRMAFLDGSLVLRWSRAGPSRVLLDTRSLWQTRPVLLRRHLTNTGPRKSSDGGSRWTSRMGAYLRRWTPIPLGVGFALIAYQQYRHVLLRERKRLAETGEEVTVLARPWEVSAYRLLPLRSISRAWGWINSCHLPVWARRPVLNWYIRTFSCELSEAAETDLLQYDNLGDFFRRELRPDARPVCPNSSLVSPCDGTVLHLGRVDDGRLEQVKGVTYTLSKFLGPANWDADEQSHKPVDSAAEDASYHQRLVSSADRTLFHCVIYLAPGDYHRFHSPVDWAVRHRRHFPGDLLSVSPRVARWIGGVFCLNERAVYTGGWEGGFFALAAVGATNVGSIRVYCDETLSTNCRRWQPGVHHDHRLGDDASDSGANKLARGEPFGEFNLGSTIVLVFEAPSSFEFSVKAGERVRVGRPLSGATVADAAAAS